MTAVDVFLDTNVLVYAYDRDAGNKHEKALRLVRGFWERGEVPVLSIQVLQEMHVNLVRRNIGLEQSANIVQQYLAWRVVSNTKPIFRRALEIQRRWELSFWDASVVSAAHQARVKELWTEDLNPGQVYDGVLAVNPLM